MLSCVNFPSNPFLLILFPPTFLLLNAYLSLQLVFIPSHHSQPSNFMQLLPFLAQATTPRNVERVGNMNDRDGILCDKDWAKGKKNEEVSFHSSLDFSFIQSRRQLLLFSRVTIPPPSSLPPSYDPSGDSLQTRSSLSLLHLT